MFDCWVLNDSVHLLELMIVIILIVEYFWCWFLPSSIHSSIHVVFMTLLGCVSELRGIRSLTRADFPAKLMEPNYRQLHNDTIALSPVVNLAKSIIYRYTPQQTREGQARIPPLMIVSHARSGKTTTLMSLHNSLLDDSINSSFPIDSKVIPIFMTFNGSSNFVRRSGESDLAGFLRVLAVELMSNPPDTKSNVSIECPEDVLVDYLKTADKPIVLLVCFVCLFLLSVHIHSWDIKVNENDRCYVFLICFIRDWTQTVETCSFLCSTALLSLYFIMKFASFFFFFFVLGGWAQPSCYWCRYDSRSGNLPSTSILWSQWALSLLHLALASHIRRQGDHRVYRWESSSSLCHCSWCCYQHGPRAISINFEMPYQPFPNRLPLGCRWFDILCLRPRFSTYILLQQLVQWSQRREMGDGTFLCWPHIDEVFHGRVLYWQAHLSYYARIWSVRSAPTRRFAPLIFSDIAIPLLQVLHRSYLCYIYFFIQIYSCGRLFVLIDGLFFHLYCYCCWFVEMKNGSIGPSIFHHYYHFSIKLLYCRVFKFDFPFIRYLWFLLWCVFLCLMSNYLYPEISCQLLFVFVLWSAPQILAPADQPMAPAGKPYFVMHMGTRNSCWNRFTIDCKLRRDNSSWLSHWVWWDFCVIQFDW